jgi:hypothetical protein
MNDDYVFTELGKFHIPDFVKQAIQKHNITKLTIGYNYQGKPMYNNQKYQRYIENTIRKIFCEFNFGGFKYINHYLLFSIPKNNKNAELLLQEFKKFYTKDKFSSFTNDDNFIFDKNMSFFKTFSNKDYYNFAFYIYGVEVNGYKYKNIEKWMVDDYHKNQKFLKFGYNYQKATFSKKPKYNQICGVDDALPIYSEIEKIF